MEQLTECRIKFNPYFAPIAIVVVITIACIISANVLSSNTPVSVYIFLSVIYCISIFVLILSGKMLSRVLKGIPAIILTAKGITLTEPGYIIEWDDIEEINFELGTGIGRHPQIRIVLKDAWKYISQTQNSLLRYYQWKTLGYFYNPFVIGEFNTNVSINKLYDIIDGYYQKYKAH